MLGTIEIEHSYVFILPDLCMLPGSSSYNKIAYGVKSSLYVQMDMRVYALGFVQLVWRKIFPLST